MFRLLRQLLNLLVAALLVYVVYHGSIALVDHLLSKIHDDFVVSLVKSYPIVVGSLGVMSSLILVGMLVLLHDIGDWITSWLFTARRKKDTDSD